MIDTTAESILTLHQAADSLPRRRRGRKCHISTLYRWTISGCRGVKLEFVQMGATRCTSREALSRFFDRLTQDKAPREDGPSSLRTSAARRREIDKSDRELDRIGV